MKWPILAIAMMLLIPLGTSGQGLQFGGDVEGDTSSVEDSWDTWSLRAFGSRKLYRFRIRDNEADRTFRFIPNNLYSVGPAITYKFISLELGINIRPRKKDRTRRFDVSLALNLGRNLVEVGYHFYRGFEVDEPGVINFPFRDDIRSQLFGFSWLRGKGKQPFSVGSLVTGQRVVRRSTGLLTYGAYWQWDKITGDSSLVPPLANEVLSPRATTINTGQFHFGATLGYAYSLVLPNNMFFFLSSSPGLGMNVARIRTEEGNFNGPLFPALHIDTRAAIGFYFTKWYIITSFQGNHNWVGWGDNVRYSYAHTRLKLTVGYRLSSTIPFLERMAQRIEQLSF